MTRTVSAVAVCSGLHQRPSLPPFFVFTLPLSITVVYSSAFTTS